MPCCSTVVTAQRPRCPSTFQPMASGLLVIDTRVEHALVDGQYAQRPATCEEAARQLGLPPLREVSSRVPRRDT